MNRGACVTGQDLCITDRVRKDFFCYTEGMELLPKKKPVFIKLVYLAILFLAIFSGVMGLYGYLWNTLRTSVAKTIARDFYLEGTVVACRSNAECSGKCPLSGKAGADEACICLKDTCHYLLGANLFSQSKFCEHDSDCTISCFEGPVAVAYYAQAGGARKDCAGGCADDSFLQVNGKENPIICRNRQCQYADGRTCFASPIPGAQL